MTKLVQQKCGYRVQRIKLHDVRDLMNIEAPTLVQSGSMHVIAFYKRMIFDANNTGPIRATIKNIYKYPNFSINEVKGPKRIGKIEKGMNEYVYKFIRPIKKGKRGRREATL